MRAVIINGETLTEGQATALWVGMNTFLLQLKEEEFARDLGHALAEGYKARVSEVMRIIYPDAVPGRVVPIERGGE